MNILPKISLQKLHNFLEHKKAEIIKSDREQYPEEDTVEYYEDYPIYLAIFEKGYSIMGGENDDELFSYTIEGLKEELDKL